MDSISTMHTLAQQLKPIFTQMSQLQEVYD